MRRALFCVLITLLLMTLLSLPVAAIEQDALFADFFAALPPEVVEELAGATTAEQAAELTGVGYLLSLFSDSLHRELTGAMPLFGRLLGLALILAVLARIGDGLGETTATRAAECGIAVVMVLLLYRTAEADIARTAATLGDMCRLSDGLLPVFCALFAAGGSGGTATAAAGGFTAVSYLLEHVAAGVLLPLLQVLFAFTLIGAVGNRLRLAGVFGTLRQVFLLLLGFVSLLLTASIGFQSTLAAAGDSLAAQSVRFAVGNLIPVVGASLGGTMRTLAASLSLVKSTLGALSLTALLLMVLPSLIALLLHRLFFSLAAAVSHALGSERAGKVFTDFRAIYDLAAATLAIGTVLLLLILGILSRCGIAVTTVG